MRNRLILGYLFNALRLCKETIIEVKMVAYNQVIFYNLVKAVREVSRLPTDSLEAIKEIVPSMLETAELHGTQPARQLIIFVLKDMMVREIEIDVSLERYIQFFDFQHYEELEVSIELAIRRSRNPRAALK